MTPTETTTVLLANLVVAPESQSPPSFAIVESAELAAEIGRIENEVQREVDIAKQRELERLRELARYD